MCSVLKMGKCCLSFHTYQPVKVVLQPASAQLIALSSTLYPGKRRAWNKACPGGQGGVASH